MTRTSPIPALTLLLNLLLFTLSTTALSTSPGCGQPLPDFLKRGWNGSSNRLSFKTHSGKTRTYLMHVPPTYSSSTPIGLVLSFHGKGRTAAYQEKLSKFSQPGINPQMLALYPEGLGKKWQGDPEASSDDVAFTLELLDTLERIFCLDRHRIFAAGKSNGGGFALNVLACHPIASQRIAAFGGVAGAYYQGDAGKGCEGRDVVMQSCKPGRKPVPVLEAHGTDDGVIGYDGGPRRGKCLPSVPRFMRAWGRRNGVGNANVTTGLFGNEVWRNEFGEGDLRGIGTHYRVKGKGHVWFDTNGTEDRGVFDVSAVIMEFFGRWSLDRTPGGKGSG